MVVLLTFCLPETLKAEKSLLDEAKADANASHGHEIAPPSSAYLPSQNEKKDINLNETTLVRTKTNQTILASRSKTTIVFLKRAFLDPLKIILLLRFPVVAITVFYASITFGSLFFLNISIQDTFSHAPYNFGVLIVGLCYIPGSVGYLVASLLGGRWLDYIMKREARKAERYDEEGNLIFRPEDRMKENAWLAAILYPSALIWYGWAAQFETFWVVPVRCVARLAQYPIH